MLKLEGNPIRKYNKAVSLSFPNAGDRDLLKFAAQYVTIQGGGGNLFDLV